MLHLDYGINAKTLLECGSIKTIATYHKPDLIAIRSNFLSPLSFSQSTHFLLRAPFSSFVIFCPSLFFSIPFLLCTYMIIFCKKNPQFSSLLNFSFVDQNSPTFPFQLSWWSCKMELLMMVRIIMVVMMIMTMVIMSILHICFWLLHVCLGPRLPIATELCLQRCTLCTQYDENLFYPYWVCNRETSLTIIIAQI